MQSKTFASIIYRYKTDKNQRDYDLPEFYLCSILKSV